MSPCNLSLCKVTGQRILSLQMVVIRNESCGGYSSFLYALYYYIATGDIISIELQLWKKNESNHKIESMFGEGRY